MNRETCLSKKLNFCILAASIIVLGACSHTTLNDRKAASEPVEVASETVGVYCASFLPALSRYGQYDFDVINTPYVLLAAENPEAAKDEAKAKIGSEVDFKEFDSRGGGLVKKKVVSVRSVVHFPKSSSCSTNGYVGSSYVQVVCSSSEGTPCPQ